MQGIVKFLSTAGGQSIPFFWIPLLIWTAFALITIVIMHFSKGLSARYRFHTDAALLAALPAGYLSYVIVHYLLSTSYLPNSLMLISIGSPTLVRATSTGPHLLITPDTWIGLTCVVLFAGILYKLTLIFLNQAGLWRFHRRLSLLDPSQVGELSPENRQFISDGKRPVHFAFTDDDIVPMTFGLYKAVIVIPGFLRFQPNKFNLAVRHELEHIQHHDYLRFRLLHLLKAMFWFHPFVHFLEKDIVLHREMDIDEAVVSQNKNLSPEYAHLLLDLADQGKHRSLSPTGLAAHPSTIKKRIIAMTHSNKSNRYHWLPVGLPVLTLIIALVMGCNNTTNDSNKQLVAQTNNPVKIRSQLNSGDSLGHPLFIVDGVTVDQETFKKLDPKSIKSVQVWKGKESVKRYGKKGINGAVIITTKEGSSASSSAPDKKPQLIGGMQSVASHVVYPKDAKKAGIQGKVFVQFTVNEDGNVVDPHVVKGIGHGCDQAAINAVKQAKFTPGTKDGKPATFKYTLPIVFKL